MVPFFDLRRRIDAVRPEMERRLTDVYDSGRFVLGPSVDELEASFARYCGTGHGVGVASGTDALWLALEAAGVGPGDEVITVSNTCAPTVSAILKARARPVLVDVDPVTLTMDPAALDAAVTNRTRAVIPVHLYGQPVDMAAVLDVARRHGLRVIEDCAQAHGAEHAGRRVGGLGDLGCFSFYPTKNLGALGDGGMVVTDDPGLAERLRLLRQYGYRERDHAVIPGHNSRLDEVQAAVLLAMLPELDAWTERRREIAARYREALAGAEDTVPPIEAPDRRHVFHLYVVRAADRDALRKRLAARAVDTLIHYPLPIHRQEGYAPHCRVGPGGLPVTEAAAAEIVSLPLYPELTDREIEEVIDAVS